MHDNANYIAMLFSTNKIINKNCTKCYIDCLGFFPVKYIVKITSNKELKDCTSETVILLKLDS